MSSHATLSAGFHGSKPVDGGLAGYTAWVARVLDAFDIGTDGTASNRRAFLQCNAGDGYPDGMTVDSEGCLWIAFWDGWCVRRYSPAGEWLETIKVPVQRPTSCAFGGPRLDRLFITSAGTGLSDKQLAEQPLAGALFAIEPGVRGVPQPTFAG